MQYDVDERNKASDQSTVELRAQFDRILTDQVIKAKIAALSAPREPWLRHPICIALVGFLLTTVAGGILSSRYQSEQAARAKRTEIAAIRQERALALIDSMSNVLAPAWRHTQRFRLSAQSYTAAQKALKSSQSDEEATRARSASAASIFAASVHLDSLREHLKPYGETALTHAAKLCALGNYEVASRFLETTRMGSDFINETSAKSVPDALPDSVVVALARRLAVFGPESVDAILDVPEDGASWWRFQPATNRKDCSKLKPR